MAARTDVVSQVADRLRGLIVTGELIGGARLNETHLAARLGVSRTPIREALRRLAGEGAVASIPNLGFYVVELSSDELDEIYSLRPQLDVMALRMGGPPAAADFAEMELVNRQLATIQSAADAVDLDNRWHRLLLSGCTNTLLLDFIDRLIDRTRRYELLLFEDPAQHQAAARQHAAIMDALHRADLDLACARLAGNLTRGNEPLRAAVRSRVNEEA